MIIISCDLRNQFGPGSHVAEKKHCGLQVMSYTHTNTNAHARAHRAHKSIRTQTRAEAPSARRPTSWSSAASHYYVHSLNRKSAPAYTYSFLYKYTYCIQRRYLFLFLRIQDASLATHLKNVKTFVLQFNCRNIIYFLIYTVITLRYKNV